MKRIWSSRTLSVGLLLLTSSGWCQAGTLEVERFRAEYPAAGRALEEKYGQIKGQCLLTRRDVGRPERSSAASFATDHGRKKLELIVKRPPKNEEIQLVFCIQPDDKQSFNLSHPPAADAYRVDGVGSPGLRETYMALFGDFLAAPFTVTGQARPLSKVMAEPHFRVVSAVPTQVDGRSCLEVSYEVGEASKDTAKVVLDPEAHWVIRRSEFHPADPNRLAVTGQIQYRPGGGGGGVPLPEKVSFSSRPFGLGCEFRSVAFDPTPESEYGMKYYKLPDLNLQLAPAPSRATFWALGLAACGLLIAYGLKRLAATWPVPIKAT